MENEKFRDGQNRDYQSYVDHRGARFVPQHATEKYVMYRTDFYGNVETRIHRIDETGRVDTSRLAQGSVHREGKSPITWLRENSDSLPQQIFPLSVIERVADVQGEPVLGRDYVMKPVPGHPGAFVREYICKDCHE